MLLPDFVGLSSVVRSNQRFSSLGASLAIVEEAGCVRLESYAGFLEVERGAVVSMPLSLGVVVDCLVTLSRNYSLAVVVCRSCARRASRCQGLEASLSQVAVVAVMTLKGFPL